MSKADALTGQQINRVLKTCQLMQHGQAKAGAIALSHTAMRVSEIARLDVKTALFPAGSIRHEINLPSQICKNTKPRTIWLTNRTARTAIQDWIDYRIQHKWGLGTSSDYQGLNPDSKLILTNRGSSYSLQPKPRRLDDGTIKEYWCCDALEQAIRNVYKRCGLPQCSSHTGRKSLVTNSVLSGVSLETMARVLGHSEASTTLGYVVIQQHVIRDMCSIEWI